MNNFIIEENFLVLSKSLKSTRPDASGNTKQYAVISMYCPNTDQFQKVMIFENYEEIMARYDVLQQYKIKIQVNINPNTNKVSTKIL